MAQTGYTPILIYASGTATNVPLAANMTSSASGAELALNYADGKLYYKNSAGVVTLLAGAGGAGIVAGSNTQVQYNNNGVFGASANLTFNGTTLTAGGLTTTGTTSTGVLSVTGNTTLGDASADTVTVNGTITSNLIFTDNTYDIGAVSATRPRTIYLGTSLMIGTGTPGAPLSFTDATGIKIQLNANAANYYAISKSAVTIAGDSQFTFTAGQTSAGEFAWNSGGSTRMLLGSTGNLLVGATSNATGSRLVVSGTSMSQGIRVVGNNPTGLTENKFTNDGTNGVVIGQYGSTSVGGSNFNVGALGTYVIGGDAAPFAIGTLVNQPLYLGVNNSTVQTIDANGRTQFGTQTIPGGCTSYLLLQRDANNVTDPTFTIYNTSTGTGAGVALILGQSNGSNIGGIGAFGGSYTTNNQKRQSGTYIWNNVNASSITLCHEQTNGSIFQGIGLTTITTTNQYGFGIGGAATSGNALRVYSSSASPVIVQTSAPTSNGGIQVITTSVNDESSISYYNQSGASYGWTVGQNTNADTDASFSFYDTNSNTNRVSIYRNTNGTMKVRGTIGVGWTTPASTGAGITFPSAFSSSSDANTLDDYEEGSWTPALRDGAVNRNPSYAFQSGNYVKIGGWVWVQWGIKLSNKGAGAGADEIRIYGLPFTTGNFGGYQEPSIRASSGELNTASNATSAQMVCANSDTYLFGRLMTNADTVWTYNDLTNGSWIIGEIFYKTA